MPSGGSATHLGARAHHVTGREVSKPDSAAGVLKLRTTPRRVGGGDPSLGFGVLEHRVTLDPMESPHPRDGFVCVSPPPVATEQELDSNNVKDRFLCDFQTKESRVRLAWCWGAGVGVLPLGGLCRN